jgi:energy-converting hydrogenase Eha subunit E
VQIQAVLRKRPGVMCPEVKHRTARAVPLELPAYAVAVIFEKYESQRAALKFV